jgi:hypothetical protein
VRAEAVFAGREATCEENFTPRKSLVKEASRQKGLMSGKLHVKRVSSWVSDQTLPPRRTMLGTRRRSEEFYADGRSGEHELTLSITTLKELRGKTRVQPARAFTCILATASSALGVARKGNPGLACSTPRSRHGNPATVSEIVLFYSSRYLYRPAEYVSS